LERKGGGLHKLSDLLRRNHVTSKLLKKEGKGKGTNLSKEREEKEEKESSSITEPLEKKKRGGTPVVPRPQCLEDTSHNIVRRYEGEREEKETKE